MFKPKAQQMWRPCYALASGGRFTGEIICGPSNGWLYAYDWMSDYVTIKKHGIAHQIERGCPNGIR